jgi:hypothetical protein
MATGILRLKVVPSDVPGATFSWRRESDGASQTFTGPNITLPEGVYTIVGHAPDYEESRTLVRMAAGPTSAAVLIFRKKVEPMKAGREEPGGAVKKFCARLQPIQRKFPFSPSSDTDAGADEVAAIFAPSGSALADMQQVLAKLIVKQGNRWEPNPASQDVHPTADLVAFMNKMQQIQDTLFSGGSTQMKMTYSLKPVPEQNVEAITLSIEGRTFTATKGNAQAQQFPWPGSGSVSVSVKAGGIYPFGAYQGIWAVWRWMFEADPRSGGGNTMQWSTVKQLHGRPQQLTDAQGHPIVMKVEVPSGGDVFDRNFFNIKCPPRAAE